MPNTGKRLWPYTALGVLPLGLLLVVGALIPEWDIDPGKLLEEAREFILRLLVAIHPVVYFLAFALLPALGFPITFFYLTAAAVYGGTPAALPLAWLAIAINIAFGYWMASSLMNPVVRRLIRYRGYEIPKPDPDNHGAVVVVTRLSPLPFALQNWALGVARLPFGVYLAYSVPVQAAMGTGMILLGDSLLHGGVSLALLGLFLLALFFLFVRLARKHYGASTSKKRKDEG